ncbi:MAG TPA: hypothetical protein GXZ52_00645 [Clostridiales bacterium]|jgi:hypothetical protein|nr:hypothetical protein [Clostridiales bacterium]
MLNTVVSALADTLRQAGIEAVCQYHPAPLDNRKGPLVCVGVKSSKLVTSGAGEYLGLRRSEDGSFTEAYGFRLELVLGLDIYSPYDGEPGGCLGCFGEISAALGRMPSGLKIRKLVCGVTAPDRVTEMFRCPCELHCMAYLICGAREETGEFTDFELKGTVINGNK